MGKWGFETRIFLECRDSISWRETIGFTMIFTLAILVTMAVVNCQEVLPVNYRDHGDYRDYRNYGVYPYNYYPYDETPKPYSFNYDSPLEDGGQSSRVEAADGTGKVEGSYTVTNDEGHTRVVDYVADQGGFRASIRTNEPGTENKNPASVLIDSSAPFTPYHYVPRYRRPYVAPVVAPIASPVAAPVVPAEVLPENAVSPVQPGLYNVPYTSRTYRPRARYPYVRY